MYGTREHASRKKETERLGESSRGREAGRLEEGGRGELVSVNLALLLSEIFAKRKAGMFPCRRR